MATTALKNPKRIWIELDSANTNEERQAICDQANLMMRKLGIPFNVFSLGNRTQYIQTQDLGGSFTELSDNGAWFNLDYLAEDPLK